MSTAEEAVRGRQYSQYGDPSACLVDPPRQSTPTAGQTTPAAHKTQRVTSRWTPLFLVSSFLLFLPLLSLAGLQQIASRPAMRVVATDSLTVEMAALPGLATHDFRAPRWRSTSAEQGFQDRLVGLVRARADDPKAWMLGYRLGRGIPSTALTGYDGDVLHYSQVRWQVLNLPEEAWWLDEAERRDAMSPQLLFARYQAELTSAWADASSRSLDASARSGTISYQQWEAATRAALAQRGVGRLTELLDRLRNSAPDEALPYYWTAHLYATVGDHAQALRFIAEGNAKPRCRSLAGYPLADLETTVASGQYDLSTLGSLLRAHSQLQSIDSTPSSLAWQQIFEDTMTIAIAKQDWHAVDALHKCFCRICQTHTTDAQALGNSFLCESKLLYSLRKSGYGQRINPTTQTSSRIAQVLSAGSPQQYGASKYWFPFAPLRQPYLRTVLAIAPEIKEVWQLDLCVKDHEAWHWTFKRDIEPALRELQAMSFEEMIAGSKK